MKEVSVISKIIPAKSRSTNYSAGGTVYRQGGSSGGTGSVDISGKLDKALFDSVFKLHYEDPDDPSLLTGVEALAGLWTESFMSSKGKNSGTGESGGGATTLGGLNNVGSWADEVPSVDRIMVQLSGATHWTSKPLSEVVGLDTDALAKYLTANDYAKKSDIPSLSDCVTESWVMAQLGGYATTAALKTVSDKLDDFLTGTDTDIVINKWKELEDFLSGFKETDTLAGALALKADKATTLAGYGITDAYTKTQSDSRYVTKDFFSRLFKAHKADGSDIAVNDTDTDIDNIEALFGLWTERWLSSSGLNAGTGSGGGGLIQTVHGYSDLGGTFSDSSLDDTFNAYTINKLAERLSVVEAGAITSVDWGVITNKPSWIGSTKPSYSYSEISGTPTSLKNPYALTVQRHGVSLGSYDGSSAKTFNIAAPSWSEVTSKPSWIGSSKPTYAFSEITGKPTTLSGYGITDAYTKTASDGKYVTALGTSGNYLTWTRNGTANSITVPYASVAAKLGTSTVGSAALPVWLNAGAATACTASSLFSALSSSSSTNLSVTVAGQTRTAALYATYLGTSSWQNILERGYSRYTTIGTSSAITTATGWYRIAQFKGSIASGQSNCILFLDRSYSNNNNEAYTFSINVSYSGNVSITQLSGSANSRLIDKIRVAWGEGSSAVPYIDFHVGVSSTNNGYFWTTVGGATSLAATVITDTPTNYVEFSTLNGMATNKSSNASGNVAVNNGALQSTLNADMLDGLHGGRNGGYALTMSLGNIPDYQYAVVGLVDLTNPSSAPSTQSLSIGKIGVYRINALSGPITIDFAVQRYYNSTNMYGSWFSIGRVSYCKPVTFKYNGVKYGGFALKLSDANGDIKILLQYGDIQPFKVNYKENLSGTVTVVNTEVNDSLTEVTLQHNALHATADYATVLATARTINGTSFNGSANITTANWGTSRSVYIADATAAHTGSAVSVNGGSNVTLKLPATITAALVGNATTATTLATARTIWGQSFNGGANVSGNMTGVGSITSSGNITTTGNVGIGTTSPSYKLHVAGVIYASTGMWSAGYVSSKGQNTSSDMRLKNKVRDITIPVRAIAEAPSFEYTWKSGGKGLEAGSSAQYWKDVVGPCVSTTPDGYYAMRYGQIALLSCISVSRELLKYITRVEGMEERLRRLERENAELLEFKRKVEKNTSLFIANGEES